MRGFKWILLKKGHPSSGLLSWNCLHIVQGWPSFPGTGSLPLLAALHEGLPQFRKLWTPNSRHQFSCLISSSGSDCIQKSQSKISKGNVVRGRLVIFTTDWSSDLKTLPCEQWPNWQCFPCRSPWVWPQAYGSAGFVHPACRRRRHSPEWLWGLFSPGLCFHRGLAMT